MTVNFCFVLFLFASKDRLLCSGYLRKETTVIPSVLPFRLPWVHSLHCLSKNFFLVSDANSLDRQPSDRTMVNEKLAIEATAISFHR